MQQHELRLPCKLRFEPRFIVAMRCGQRSIVTNGACDFAPEDSGESVYTRLRGCHPDVVRVAERSFRCTRLSMSLLALWLASPVLHCRFSAQIARQRLELEPQGRDNRAGALCAQHPAGDAEPEARAALAAPGYGFMAPPPRPAGARARLSRPTSTSRAASWPPWNGPHPSASPRCRRRWTSANTSTGPLRARISRSPPPTARRCWR